MSHYRDLASALRAAGLPVLSVSGPSSEADALIACSKDVSVHVAEAGAHVSRWCESVPALRMGSSHPPWDARAIAADVSAALAGAAPFAC